MENLIFSRTIQMKGSAKVISEGNTFENHFVANKRHQLQKILVKNELKALRLYFFQQNDLKIKLIRISSRKLDKHDNLRMAFKFIVDAIAELIFPGKAAGRADDAENLEWDYDQEKGPPKFNGFRIEIFSKY